MSTAGFRASALAVAVMAASALRADAGGHGAQNSPRLDVEEYVLDNGLRVALQPDSRVPQVAVSILVHAGASIDRPGRSGFAHLFEHLIFQGSEHISKPTQDTLFVKIGSSDNAVTRYDWTEFEMKGPSQQLETMLWLESDRLGFLQIGERSLEGQKEVVREERRQRFEADPYWPADVRLWESIFPPPHPYGRTVIGSHEDLEKAAPRDVAGFYREHYLAANASLVVTGDIRTGDARRLIARYFGALPRARRPPARSRPRVLASGLVADERMNAVVPQPRVSFAWLLPPAGDPRASAMPVVASMLGDGAGSILGQKLIRERRVAQDVKCAYEPLSLGSYLQCDCFLPPGGDPPRVVESVTEAIRDLADRGVDDVVLRRARTHWKVDRLRQLESLADRARLLNRFVAYFGTAGRLPDEWRGVESIDGETVKKLAQDYLVEGRHAVVSVVPSTP
jgi:zinc protease